MGSQPAPVASSPLDPAVLTLMVGASLRQLPGTGSMSPEEAAQQRQAALVALASLRPRDPVEAMLAGQVISAHFAAMDCFHRTMLPDLGETHGIRVRGQAVTLSRLMSATLRELRAMKADPPAFPLLEGEATELAPPPRPKTPPVQPSKTAAKPEARPSPPLPPACGTAPPPVGPRQGAPAWKTQPGKQASLTDEERARQIMAEVSARSMTALPGLMARQTGPLSLPDRPAG